MKKLRYDPIPNSKRGTDGCATCANSREDVQKRVDTQLTQHYCCVVLPDLVDIGGPWKVLPPGVHDASLEEVRLRYATNERRQMLFEGFKRGFLVLTAAGCTVVVADEPCANTVIPDKVMLVTASTATIFCR